MKRNGNRTRTLFRYAIILSLIMLVSGLIVNKLVSTTVTDREHWNNKADSVLLQTKIVYPRRGDILAADGSVLATNLQYYTLRIDFKCERFAEDSLRKYLPQLLDSMALYFPVRTREDWAKHLDKQLKRQPADRSRSFPFITNVSYSDLQRIKRFPFFNIKNIRTGLTYEPYMRRVHPYGTMARRSIGSVGQDSSWVGFRGISGLEGALDTPLYGTPGVARKIQLTRGIVNWADTAAVNGYNIRTTIDINLQDIVENELNNMLELTRAEWGLAVLMEVKTGDIKAISNLEDIKNRRHYKEGLNRAVLGYEPGSVIKTLSMMIAIEDKLVSPDEYINTAGPFAYAGGRPISDSHNNGTIKVREVIERSSNIGMTKIIARGYDRHPSHWRKRVLQTGFLDTISTGLRGEQPAVFGEVKDDRGGRIDMARQCYGYTTLVPPMRTLSLYNAIANDGRYVKPRLYTRLTNELIDTILPETYIRDQVCSPRTASIMRDMLTSVVYGEHGTARRLRDPRVRIAGKTGTCYMTDPRTGRYDNRKRLAFCGFFPADKPIYSCIVLMCDPREYATGAAGTSGEVLKNIALKLYSRGMLHNSADFHEADKPENHTSVPTLYATAQPGRADNVSNHLGINRRKVISSPADKPGVPDVRGYGLRDAVARLESAGLSVTFKGSGYVSQQNPLPGSPITRGSSVRLILHE